MKRLIALAVAVSATAFGYAQMDHQVGAKAGYNHLFLKYDNLLTTSPSTSSTQELNGGGFVLGGYYNYTPMDDLFLQAELLLSNRMWNEISTSVYDGQVSTITQTYTHYTNNYLEIPLLAKYGLNLTKRKYGDKKYLFFYGGTSTHILMSTKGTQQETFRVDASGQKTVTQNETTLDKGDLKNYFSPFQVSGLAGIQFTFGFGLNVDFRYQFMMNPASRVTPEATLASDFSVLKQNLATITLGYNFLWDY
ncbi:PorT family protein [Crocinitomicaceae bacterium]|nr:PorT family protein [Crocinitomicaceae bacterium]